MLTEMKQRATSNDTFARAVVVSVIPHVDAKPKVRVLNNSPVRRSATQGSLALRCGRSGSPSPSSSAVKKPFWRR
jgi:hypothetical protein